MKTPNTQRAVALWPLVLRDRLPTVSEAVGAMEAPLHESYWWFDGLNFNRPVIAEVFVSAHITEGPKVRVKFREETPVGGFTAEHFAGRSFRMWGPIPLPPQLSSQNKKIIHAEDQP
jgi:hypothetical protein